MASTRQWKPGAEQEILERIAQGESLNAICKADGMPLESSVRYRVTTDADFAQRYAAAKDIGIDCMVEQALAAAKERLLETEEEIYRDASGNISGQRQMKRDNYNRSRLYVDTVKWYATKIAAKRYGDRLQHEHAGKDGEAIIFRFEDSAAKPPDAD